MTTKEKKSSDIFADYARYYNLLYKDKDYVGEADYVAGLIKRFRSNAKTILELGAGTGIHAIHLAKKGYEITGIEISADMIKIAKQKAAETPRPQSSKVLFKKGDIRTIRMNKKYDAVISLFHVMSYQNTNADILAAFATAREHLLPGGVFLFDVWYGPAVLTEKPSVRIKRMEDEQMSVTRIAEPVKRTNENLVEVHYNVFVQDKNSTATNQSQETHIMRYFFKPEIELLAMRTSFQHQLAEEWMSGKPLGNNTWSACFVLRATAA